MILIALGGNLETAEFGAPRNTLAASLEFLAVRGVETVGLSRWYRTPPVPPSDQPWFVNAVARVATAHPPEDLLGLLHEIEARLGPLASPPSEGRTRERASRRRRA